MEIGITFKEEMVNIRNSKVVDLIPKVEDNSVRVDVNGPCANAAKILDKYGVELKLAPEGKIDSVIEEARH